MSARSRSQPWWGTRRRPPAEVFVPDLNAWLARTAPGSIFLTFGRALFEDQAINGLVRRYAEEDRRRLTESIRFGLEGLPEQTNTDDGREYIKSEIVKALARTCGKRLDCGGECYRPPGHPPPCLCVGDRGEPGTCPA